MSDDFLLRPLDAPPAYAAVVARIRRAVALGLLVPGDRLPAERALADGLGVSRVTVREALRVLQGEGLLITKRGSGGTVVSSTATPNRGEDDLDTLREVFELRVTVETMAARLAAQRAAPADVDALDACQEALAASADVHAFRRADSAFHLAIATLSGNATLRGIVEDLRAAAFTRLDARDFAVIHESSSRGHGAVIDAIRRGDPDAAAEAMAAHIEQARDEVLDVLGHTAPPAGIEPATNRLEGGCSIR